jgi:hypothetical protein|tara:strand:+ start:133 stop:279 length:147 start_codon:yes stop_codon:yes gene_type:complete
VEQVQEVNVVLQQFFLMQEQVDQVEEAKVIQDLHHQVQKLEQQEILPQ